MAPLPQNNTIRVRVTYKADDKQHTVNFRAAAGATGDDIRIATSALFNAIGPDCVLLTLQNIDVAQAGQDVFLPISLPTVVTFGAGSSDDVGDATFISWTGRSTGGRRIKLGIYGYKYLNNVGDFRKPLSASVPAQNVWNLLEGAEGMFVAVDGLGVSWKSYFNIGMNAYWQRKLRRV